MSRSVSVGMRLAGAVICMASIFVPSMTMVSGDEHGVYYSPESFFSLVYGFFWTPITIGVMAFLATAALCLFSERARYVLLAGLFALFFFTFVMWPYYGAGLRAEVGLLLPVIGTLLCLFAPVVGGAREGSARSATESKEPAGQ